MELNKLINTLVALRESGTLTANATVFVRGNAFEVEEIEVTIFNNRDDEELAESCIVLSDGTKQ